MANWIFQALYASSKVVFSFKETLVLPGQVLLYTGSMEQSKL